MASHAIVSVREVMVSLDRLSTGVPKAVNDELEWAAQLIARRMRAKAPKFQSALVNSIRVDSPTEGVKEIRPGVQHAVYMEEGIRPGGKGLPKWDQASPSVVEWLKKHPFKGKRKPASKSLKAAMGDTELRDRYEALAWHVRHKGVKAQPFVKPAFDELAPLVQSRLQAAVNAAVQAAGGSAGGGA